MLVVLNEPYLLFDFKKYFLIQHSLLPHGSDEHCCVQAEMKMILFEEDII
jgi:hypothetical protein